MMKVPVVDQCCCGATLKTGCLIIGGVLLAFSTIVVLSLSVQADTLKHLVSVHSEIDEEIRVLRKVFIAYAVVAAGEIVINMCLLYGTIKCQAQFIFAWVVCYVILIVVRILIHISISVAYFASGNVVGGIGLLIGLGINAAVIAYCIIVVHSHYMVVKAGAIEPEVMVEEAPEPQR